MTLSLAQNAIALLIDLAERGEIDPWDVQVVEVIDRFLSKLQPTLEVSSSEAGRAPYEADLLQSGQAFLYTSILLLLKADTLARSEIEEEPEESLEAEDFIAPLPLHLERRIRRRATAPPAPNRRVTLQELIAQLNLMAAAVADPKPQRASIRRPRPQSRSQAIRAIAQLAHQENLSEVAAALAKFLDKNWQAIHLEDQWCDFDLLLNLWVGSPQYEEVEGHPAQPQPVSSSQVSSSQTATSPQPASHASTHDRVGVFWALLFLSAQSKVELAQEEFYQDLKVRSLVDHSASVESIQSAAFVLSD
ncbi:MAG: segregation/condensation protein A [Timaviella obliquedivisa GSE-PSE-MK23-08B]|jgi:segregation and condensation protein A|nr:segregation/condensation protein A [Timaviella obliquedivisa GSE-PSE-MK23-08B]